jgi:hypothetical protein
MLGLLAALAYAPVITIALCVLWLARWLVLDFFLALIGGFGLGLGLRGAGFGRRSNGASRSRRRLFRKD